MVGGVYGLAALGLNLIFGTLRVINVAHGAFIMLGMYFAYWLFNLYGVDPFISLFLVLPPFFVMGVAFHKVLVTPFAKLRPIEQELFPAITTLALAIIMENIALIFWKQDVRGIVLPYLTQGVSFGLITVALVRLVAFFIALIAYAAMYVFFSRTYIGRAIRAFTQDSEAASLMGVNTSLIPLIGAGLGIAITGLAGVLLGPVTSIFPRVGWSYLIISFVIVVLGGLGSIIGSVVGGMIIGIVEALAVQYVSGLAAPLIMMVVFLIVLRVRPSGLWGK